MYPSALAIYPCCCHIADITDSKLGCSFLVLQVQIQLGCPLHLSLNFTNTAVLELQQCLISHVSRFYTILRTPSFTLSSLTLSLTFLDDDDGANATMTADTRAVSAIRYSRGLSLML